MLRDHSREPGNLGAVHFQLVLRRAGEAKMKENRILSHRPNQLTAEDAEVRAEDAEESFLCVTLRKPLRPLRLKRNLRNPTARLIKLSALVITLVFSFTAFSQSRATIAGHVKDLRGASVAGAEVQLRSRSGIHLSATTDDNGAYSFMNLASGDYVVEVKAKGFASFTSNELRVTRGNSLTNDVQLSVETVNENVVVTASGTAQRIDETSKAVSTLDEQTIEARRDLSLPVRLRAIP